MIQFNMPWEFGFPLNQLKERDVYIEEDNGQQCISLWWVISQKVTGERTFPKARGFEEEQNFRTDSPTCSREGVKISSACIATHRWAVNSTDIEKKP